MPPAGLRGPNRFVLHPDSAQAETMPSSCRLGLEAGTVISMQGGGGYGEPARRARSSIASDLKEGYVTVGGMRRGCWIDPDALKS